ncbi:unnamed protein product [Blepharisma stoltei]|uniref:Uncharacterized protein n=1 Tax=Blepharisma stoltei TaxID=1481888 RepID=A0AAU9JIW6_9CILI|nr:unnamed protein product [Blepharisma stoltei]
MSRNVNTYPNLKLTARKKPHTSLYQATKNEVEHDLELLYCMDDCSQTTTASHEFERKKIPNKKTKKHFRHKKIDENSAVQGLSLLLDSKEPMKKSDTVIKIAIPKKKHIEMIKLPIPPQMQPDFIAYRKEILNCFANNFWREIGFPQKYLSKFYESTKIIPSERDNLICPKGKGSMHTALAHMISQEKAKIKLPQLQILNNLA